MKVSKKCQYAMKAVFELAWQDQSEPLGTDKVAGAQHISRRFTEIILNELKRGGFVESRRGSKGGYRLARNPKDLTVYEIIESIEGPFSLAKNIDNVTSRGDEAFKAFWKEVSNAFTDVCKKTTFMDLLEYERTVTEKYELNYCI